MTNDDVQWLLAWPAVDEGCELMALRFAADVSTAREAGLQSITIDIATAENAATHLAAAALLLTRYDERYGE